MKTMDHSLEKIWSMLSAPHYSEANVLGAWRMCPEPWWSIHLKSYDSALNPNPRLRVTTVQLETNLSCLGKSHFLLKSRNLQRRSRGRTYNGPNGNSTQATRTLHYQIYKRAVAQILQTWKVSSGHCHLGLTASEQSVQSRLQNPRRCQSTNTSGVWRLTHQHSSKQQCFTDAGHGASSSFRPHAGENVHVSHGRGACRTELAACWTHCCRDGGYPPVEMFRLSEAHN